MLFKYLFYNNKYFQEFEINNNMNQNYINTYHKFQSY